MTEEMTGKERVMAALAGKEFDRYPAVSFTSVATKDQMKKVKASYPQAHTDAVKMAALAAAGHELVGFDTVSPYFSVLLEAAALGAKVEWGNETISPYVSKVPFRRLEDIQIQRDFLERNEMQQLLKCICILKRKYGQTAAVIGKVMGPWTLAYNLYGVEKLMLDMILEPKRTKQVIEDLSQVSIDFAKAQFHAGIDALTWAEHATRDLVSAELYQEFVYPVHDRICRELKAYGPVILHVCGNVEDRFPLFVKAGFTCFHLDSRNNVPNLVRQGEGKIQFAGGINNPITLMRGSVRQIEKEVENNIKYGVTMVGPECAIQTNIPLKNLLTLVRAIHGFKK